MDAQNNNLQRQSENHQQHKCPRCDSSNTKFCYYNNYSLSQPRYFCKACRRYWTQGGTLRNVPIGGGCRKTKRPRTASSPCFSATTQGLLNVMHPQTSGSATVGGVSSQYGLTLPSLKSPNHFQHPTTHLFPHQTSVIPPGPFYTNSSAATNHHPQPGIGSSLLQITHRPFNPSH